jgi:hypothetical protein
VSLPLKPGGSDEISHYGLENYGLETMQTKIIYIKILKKLKKKKKILTYKSPPMKIVSAWLCIGKFY